jgi:hypothetical protein
MWQGVSIPAIPSDASESSKINNKLPNREAKRTKCPGRQKAMGSAPVMQWRRGIDE